MFFETKSIDVNREVRLVEKHVKWMADSYFEALWSDWLPNVGLCGSLYPLMRSQAQEAIFN